MSIDDGTCGTVDDYSSIPTAPTAPSIGASDSMALPLDYAIEPAYNAAIAEASSVDLHSPNDLDYRARFGLGASIGPGGAFAGVSIDGSYDISLFAEGAIKASTTPMPRDFASFKFGDIGAGHNADGFRDSVALKGSMGPYNIAFQSTGNIPPKLDLGPSLFDPGSAIRGSATFEVKGEYDFSLSRFTFNNVFWPVVQPMFDQFGIPSRNPSY
jgi:hypothetical protein